MKLELCYQIKYIALHSSNGHLKNARSLKIERTQYTFNCFPGGLEAQANALPEAAASLAWLLILGRFLCATFMQKISVKKCM